jgi:hypothetical protein
MNNTLPKFFVWTEAFNCGELLDPFLSSYLKHNNYPIFVYGFKSDLEKISVRNSLVRPVDLSNIKFRKKLIEEEIKSAYKHGHLGTATLWAFLIKTREETYFVHLDADNIFLDNVISDFEVAIKEGFDMAGSRRAYKNRGYRQSGIDGSLLNWRPDAINTDCFCFSRTKINKLSFKWLIRKIQGKRTSLLPVVDFFDPITFELLMKRTKIKYFEFETNDESRSSNLGFIDKRISFAAVGSGINFYKNPEVSTSEGYRKFALASYSLYSKYFLDENLPIPPLEAPDLVKKLESLDLDSWTLRK